MRKKTKSSKKVIAPIVVMVCKDHPNYRAVYPPKTDCIICWKIYTTRMKSIIKDLKVEIKTLKKELKDARKR